MIRWDPPGYSVVFSTRVGGVSEGPYDSLNLGRLTGDEVERVDENRRLLCAAIDADVESAERSGVTGTPTFFVNGERHTGPHDSGSLAEALDRVAG